MRIVALVIAAQRPSDKKVFIFTTKVDMSTVNLLDRSTKKETFKFLCRESIPILQRGTRNKVIHEDNTVYILISDKQQLGAYAFVEGLYPSQRVIYDLLDKSIEEFQKSHDNFWPTLEQDQNLQCPEIDKMFKLYQNPENVDKVYQAQSSVDELKETIHENIAKMLERQGQIDVLIEKSHDLNNASKAFMKDTQKLNRSGAGCCCNIY